VLIIACPVRARARHADGAARRHRAAARSSAAHQGPEVLESTRRVDTIVLDKTGTVTTGA
jgi:Cu+-exporting ATPase